MTGAGVCGIRALGSRLITEDTLLQMAAAQDHRAGGGADVWLGPGVGLARSRRAAGPHAPLAEVRPQPVRSADGRWVVVLDGAIVNRTSLRAYLDRPLRGDDAELVAAGLALQGIGFVERVEGRFALVAHDLRTGTTHLVRDRIGALPLHYRRVPGGVAFASEVKALLVLGPPADVDHRSLDAYLAHRTVPAPDTLVEGVRKVRPAHRVAVMPDGHLEETAYWAPPDADPEGTWTADDAVESVRDGVREAVRSALEAGAPPGVHLTGGIAGSVVAAQARQLLGDEPVHTFSLALGDDAGEELARTRRVSDLLDTRHHDVRLGAGDVAELWGPLTWHRDAPLSGPADLAAHVLARTAAEHVPVLLCPQGADELFGGHSRHRLARVAERSYGLPAPLRSGLERRVERRLGATFTTSERRRLLGRKAPPERRASPVAGVRHTLPDDVLERLDRMATAADLEVRLPLLESRLVELAFRLPSPVKVRAGCTTWVLREAARPLLPDEVLERRVPEPGTGSWWYAGVRDTVRERLTGPGSWVAQNLDGAMVGDMMLRHEHGAHEHDRIWTLLSLELWHESFFATVPAVPRPRGAVHRTATGAARLS
ncbi:asparagine synthetase B [Nocardioides flavus (ex Wang et al. 2016)]|uniref:asparagine synthase (glutamine-hydrolyzing) n=1 Tax=Nocardioides flavus (ex Wang et al. 2016) TaxID=2058780 RepID=A0ABQ3HPW9_9ACTN|nr:asparagine synthase-related protein [Nocardioides flavus (ex Wang et al. 2016)]GHE18179.1 asparagine synthetase B [Nocardioides flavus (ex Wang et al. 2016)]